MFKNDSARVAFLLCDVASIFGTETVKWEDIPVTGFSGFFLALAIWPVFSLLFTLFMWCFAAFGLWIYSFIKPLNLVFKERS
ncbi:hypothetical protein A6E00_01955 [Vibrio diabolicus]|nr:hypothetical protein AAW52_17190 [Vibrio diabolicus]OCH67130.1 hypothetical protein A6E00_01955 [Vibrio diabolicus]